jgi:amino acid adenylation domain-containing protein
MSDYSSQGYEKSPKPEAILDSCPATSSGAFPIEEVETSIPARFAKMVQRYPDRLAVKMGQRSLTYDQLNRAANRIAHAIAARCSEDGRAVATLFEPGIDVVSAVLGVLKSGNLYVALDPSFPRERLKNIVGDSQAGIIVTDRRNLELAQEIVSVGGVAVTVDVTEQFPDSEFEKSLSPGDLAVITYTSGSTGTPKGVAHTHRNLLSKCFAYTWHKRVLPDDRVSLFHSLSFAASHGNFLIALLNGAALFPFDIKSAGIPRLATWLEEERISISHVPVMVFRELAKVLPSQAGLPSLRIIYLSGAPITKLDFDRYKEACSDATQLEIGMGSTETGHICLAMLDKTFVFPESGTPLGYPLPGKNVFLIDENGRDVGINEIGEIAVRSADLSAGYWRQPQLTAEKFLPVPGDPPQHIYLTGDLGRMLPDGFLIHLGRKDFMVKIRGYRVDIGEIESRLREHRQITEAAVAYWDRAAGEKSLVGYVVLCPEAIVNVSDLKEFLRARLPDYMIPHSFRFLPVLPLTNGKLDRSALSNPDNQRPSLMTPYVAPRSELEARLAGIWSEVLVIDPIGVRDNFFNLGGHSLAASQVISRIIQSFKLELPVKLLFNAPTVEEMADIISQHQAAPASRTDLEKTLRQIEAMTENDARQLLALKGIAPRS